jgi:dephospho-CoA kinase
MIIGITGKIGSGKSTFAKLFTLLGAQVIDVDNEAKHLYFRNDIQKKVEFILGKPILTREGNINFKAIAESYFSQPGIYAKINDLLYPILFQEIQKKIISCSSPIIVLDAAMLFEIGLNSLCDLIVEVKTPLPLRWKRIKQRNPSMTYKDFLLRNRWQRFHKENFIIEIHNDHKNSLLKQFEDFVIHYIQH